MGGIIPYYRWKVVELFKRLGDEEENNNIQRGYYSVVLKDNEWIQNKVDYWQYYQIKEGKDCKMWWEGPKGFNEPRDHKHEKEWASLPDFIKPYFNAIEMLEFPGHYYPIRYFKQHD